jgi:hypothetical protein
MQGGRLNDVAGMSLLPANLCWSKPKTVHYICRGIGFPAS